LTRFENLDNNQPKINDRVLLNPVADKLWNICLQQAACTIHKLLSQRPQLSPILRDSHAFHLQLTLSRVAACFSRNQAALLLRL